MLNSASYTLHTFKEDEMKKREKSKPLVVASIIGALHVALTIFYLVVVPPESDNLAMLYIDFPLTYIGVEYFPGLFYNDKSFVLALYLIAGTLMYFIAAYIMTAFFVTTSKIFTNKKSE
ncbi:MAG: hypothetical protein BMS9Abin26_0582 [Gammaproteobacteria bacterium]|nr:MAG: hypothetical protein BMS9Abin26_0582 [Gammaproteobacteria bacterium]